MIRFEEGERELDMGADILDMLREQGHDPSAAQLEGLRRTPARWWAAMYEMTNGYRTDVAALLSVQFADVPADEMVLLRGIEFSSLCEHHLLPFTGTATVAYLPAEHRVVGLSKLARLVEAHAHRLQVQERLTHDVASDLMQHLQPLGAACVVRAVHCCMACRGVRRTAEMVTSALLGRFRELAIRGEFLTLALA